VESDYQPLKQQRNLGLLLRRFVLDYLPHTSTHTMFVCVIFLLLQSCHHMQRLAEARAAELERTRDERARKEQKRQLREQQRLEEQ
jgi:hypothetical protein